MVDWELPRVSCTGVVSGAGIVHTIPQKMQGVSMTVRINRVVPLVCLCSLGALSVLGAFTASHASQPERNAPAPRAGGAPDVGAMLIKGLGESEGCLKVITAQTSVGTSTIIAWFEDKAAVERWYYSPTHAMTMRMVGSSTSAKKPLEHVKDADAPVMVMASITMGEKGVLPGPMPVSQISIELYTPLDAGASVNGRLMPEAIELEHFNALTIEPDAGEG